MTVVGVVTQPDKPAGRKQTLTLSPVKALAMKRGIPVIQPVALRRPAVIAALARFTPDVGIVAAYGRILPPDVLAIPRHGHLNVHASLLPHWRGAWPIGASILAGDAETGVSIMLLDEGMDTGGVLATRAVTIHLADTTESLERTLAKSGAELMIETLPDYLSASISPLAQDESLATYCRPVRKADGVIGWTQTSEQIERQVRAMHPWPGAITTWQGKQLRLLKAHVVVDDKNEGTKPGHVLAYDKGAAVTTGAGLLVIDELQLEGKSPAPARAFVNGYRDFVGSRLE